MSDDEVVEVKEIVTETIVSEPEHPTEIEAQIAVAKAEAGAERAVEAAQMLEQAAAIQVAQIAIEAENQIEQHEEKVNELEYDQKWQQEQINYLTQTMEKVVEKMEALESKLLTPQPSEEIPPTVEVISQNENADGLPEQLDQQPPEIQVPPSPRRKIKAL